MKKELHYFIVVLLMSLLFIFKSEAQTPSELRQMREQKAQQNTNAGQSASDRHLAKVQQKLNNAVFGDDDLMFAVNDVPAKWKNESAVILAFKADFKYYTKAHMCDLSETSRFRIKLLDKAAVDAFSSFYFSYNSDIGTEGAGFRIIKKDGTIINVDLSKAVDVESTDHIPDYEALYGGSSFLNIDYKKIAISDLEPGDIIDYYYQYEYGYLKMGADVVAYPAQIMLLANTYPTLAQKLNFQVERGFYINFGSYNGAPKLVQSDDVNHRTKIFSITDNNRDKQANEKFDFPYRTNPTIKFQVVYTSERKKDDEPYFLGDPLVPVTQVTPDMVQKVADRIATLPDDNVTNDADAIIKYMREKHGNITDNTEYLKDAYYYLRYYKLSFQAKTEFQFEDEYADNPYAGLSYSGRSTLVNGTISDVYFVKTLGAICHERKMDYDFLFTTPRNYGTLDNLLLTDEMSWILRVKEGDSYTYFYPFNRYRDPDEGIGAIEGADAYVILPNKNSRVATMDREKIPVSSYNDNSFTFDMNVTFDPALDGKATISRTVTVKGLSKSYYIPEALVEDDYENKDIERYRTTRDELTDDQYVAKIHNGKKNSEAVRKIQASLADENKDRMENMKAFAQVDFDVDSYDSFNLISDGREMDSTDLIFKESFKIKNMLAKVGPNYIANVGILVGKQMNIKDTDLVRSDNVYIDHDFSINNQVVITIPKGYTVQGLDKLNVNVTNGTGGFISSASLVNDKLSIKTQQYYTKVFLPNSSWTDFVKVLRAMYDFSQQKILLKKV